MIYARDTVYAYWFQVRCIPLPVQNLKVNQYYQTPHSMSMINTNYVDDLFSFGARTPNQKVLWLDIPVY